MSAQIKDKIISIIRADFDQTPKNWGGDGWYDNAEEVADSIVALFASPQTDLVSRAEVLRVIRALGDQDADLALYGAADNVRAREYGEAAATRACCAIALMPPASPSPAPAAVEDLVARLNAYWETWSLDCKGPSILREAAAALFTLAAKYGEACQKIVDLECKLGEALQDKTRIEAERDEAVARAQGMSRDANFNGSASDAWKAEAEKQKERAEKFIWQVRDTCTRAEAAESRASALEGEVERLRVALEPFAAGTEVFFADDPDDRVVSLGRWHGGSPLSQELPRLYADIALTVAHFRRARAATRKETP